MKPISSLADRWVFLFAMYLAIMNSYQLDNKDLDQDFLNGLPVLCKAVLKKSDVETNRVKAGDKIVVQLSNRSKYMGKVVDFRYTVEGAYVIGFLEITKA